ncbi:LacI family DNA-binding transcriptional regulator [Streptococcus halotolerans]|uniref:LacI family DNA-binding transcriptional regulator n=1 Tax=Streptococcus halotolerans TaxID=1814128 RepID=UPI000787CC7A|nr:LacI family DNA-binding transcriptional regulator [Streptococcus halotolerans]
MATIKDVAKLAGVSVGTVSKYLNGFKVKEKTRIAVEGAIKELEYEPNAYAKGLKTNRTNSVVLIIPSIWHPFFSELTYYIEQTLREQGLKLILCNTRDNLDAEIEYVTMARQNKVDGIIAITYSNIDNYITSDMAVVSIDRFFSANTDFISSDNYRGGYLGAKVLSQRGSSVLAYVGHGSSYENDTTARLDGFKAYCEEYDIPYHLCYDSDSRKEYQNRLIEFINQIVSGQIKVDGILTASDTHAFNVYELLTQRNIRVPEDIQLIGFDGSQQSYSAPVFLSSIRQDVPTIAKEAVACLLERINDRNNNHPVVRKKIPVSFTEGKTTR